MGCGNSKDLGEVEEPAELNAKKELTEADAAALVAAKEQAEYEAALEVVSKEKAEHDAAVLNMNKEQEEAEAARRAADEAAGNLDALLELAAKARSEADNASNSNKAAKDQEVALLEEAVIVARRQKEEADATAEREQAEADEAVRIEEKERLEYEEASRQAEKEMLEAARANAIAIKEREEANEAASQTEEAKRLAQIKKDEADAKAAEIQAKRDAAPYYHKGNLMKKGDDMMGAWKSRFFVANNQKDNFTIDYFESEGGKKKGTIDCCGFKAVAFNSEDIAANGPNGIKIVPKNSGRTWFVKADSASSQAEWLRVFARACDNAGLSGSNVVVETKK